MATRQPHILAIDLGTTACKVALVTTTGKVAALETEPNRLYVLPGGGTEQDPGEWWVSIDRAVKRLLGQAAVPPDSIVAVGCTSQWSGTVPVDAAGQPLRRAIIWMDSRGEPFVRRITGGPVRVAGYGVDKIWQWVRKTAGIPAHSGKDPVAHILYLKHMEPGVYRATYKFLEPKDYLNLRLTGKFAATYDSIALHWVTDNRNLSRVRYDPALLRLAGLEREKLPDLRSPVDLLAPLRPEVAAEWGLPAGVPVVAGSPDVQSAAIGSGATRDYQAHLYVGTSSWITCHLPFKRTDVVHNIASLPAGIPGRYFAANEQETAGACLNFLRDNLLFHPDGLGEAPSPENVFGIFEKAAETVPPGSGNVIFTPWLCGERTPVEDRFVRSGFYNLSLGTTRPHIIRAVFEGVAYNARWLLGAVESFVRRRLDPIRIIGGGARSDLWCRIFADVLDRTIQRVEEPVAANVRGAALIAAVGIGAMTFDDMPEHVTVAETFRPNPENRKQYAELFREFVGFYRRNRAAHARLNACRAGIVQ
ncbi:MAG: FGGY-family carbohydrate kinase [Bacillota bacterium]